MPRTFSLLSLAAIYWAVVSLVPESRVSLVAWLGLYLACNIGAVEAWARLPASFGSRFWLAVALYSGLFAAMFFGADGALDALHGVHRIKAHVAESLGGLELWFVLCPGVVSAALASSLHARLGGGRVER